MEGEIERQALKKEKDDASKKRLETLELQSKWAPGQPVWTGMVHGRPVSVQVRPALNGYDLAHRGVRVRAHVYTEQEAAMAALMPEKVAPVPEWRASVPERAEPVMARSV